MGNPVIYDGEEVDLAAIGQAHEESGISTKEIEKLIGLTPISDIHGVKIEELTEDERAELARDLELRETLQWCALIVE